MNAIKASVELLRNDGNNENVNAVNSNNLVVIAPEELQDYAYIQVEIVKCKEISIFVLKFFINKWLSLNLIKANQKAQKNSKNSIFSTKFSLFTTNFFRDSNNSRGAEPDNWHDILEKTQNAIYCKEIYNQV